jgi:very-short-patch-repair endonuclease
LVSPSRSAIARLEIQATGADRPFYIADFCCSDARLIIELDGGHHATRILEDANRTKILEAMGYLVLRFWNNEVMQNIEGVLEEILNTLKQYRSEPPHPDPLPFGEREKKA